MTEHTTGTIEKRRLGVNGPVVDTVAIGTWAMGGTQWGPSDDEDSLAAIRAGLDAGMTFIDTADTYGEGRAEEVVGRAIAGRRDGIFLATKVGVLGNDESGWQITLSREHILEGCEDSLRRLGTDVIDLYQLHWPDRSTPLEESLEALAELQRQGKIRYAGVSNFHAPLLEEAARQIPIVSLQSPLSMLERNVLNEDLPAAHRLGVGFLAYGPLARGMLTGKFRGAPPSFPKTDVRSRDRRFQNEGWDHSQRVVDAVIALAQKYNRTPGQVAINWALCQPGVTTALVGARKPSQAREIPGGTGWRLEDTDLATMDTLLKENSF